MCTKFSGCVTKYDSLIPEGLELEVGLLVSCPGGWLEFEIEGADVQLPNCRDV